MGTNDHLHEQRGYCGNKYCVTDGCLNPPESGSGFCAKHGCGIAPQSKAAKELHAAAAATAAKIHPLGGGPTRATILPDDPTGRKEYPLATGLFDYFPDALCAVAHLSWKGNQQHNPGQPTFWHRGKSGDEPDTMLRHFAQRGTLDKDGERHSAKVAWRSLAILQKEIEEERRG